MFDFPIIPDSILVSHDEDDVFVSFHFTTPHHWTSEHLALFLEGWLRAEALRKGYVALEADVAVIRE